MTEMPVAPRSDPTHPVQPSTGMVAPIVEQQSNGVNDPTFWQGLDVQSQGLVAESIPQPPQNDAEWQSLVDESGSIGGADAPVISALSAGTPAATEATVTWTTDKDATTKLSYGTTAGSFTEGPPEDYTYTTTHSVTLTGLTAETTYYVSVGSRDADGNASTDEVSFTTAAAAP